MYLSKQALEELRKKGEEDLKQMNAKSEGSKYRSVVGKEVVCVQCQHNHFQEGKALLNTRGLTFLDLDWLNESATTLMCNQCGYIHWFAKEVKKID